MRAYVMAEFLATAQQITTGGPTFLSGNRMIQPQQAYVTNVVSRRQKRRYVISAGRRLDDK